MVERLIPLASCVECRRDFPMEDLVLTYGEPDTTGGNPTYVYKCHECMRLELPPDEGPRYGS